MGSGGAGSSPSTSSCGWRCEAMRQRLSLRVNPLLQRGPGSPVLSLQGPPACPGTAPHGPWALTGTGSTRTLLGRTRACSDREPASLRLRQAQAPRVPHHPPVSWGRPSPGGSLSLLACKPQGGERPQQHGPQYLQVLSSMGTRLHPWGRSYTHGDEVTSMGTRTCMCDEQDSMRGMRHLEVKLNPCLSQGSLHAQLLIKTYQDKN